MNDLQMTLLLVGGGGIVAMIAYNWWQDFRLRKQANERFGSTDQDPLLATTHRSEPGFNVPESQEAQVDAMNQPASADLVLVDNVPQPLLESNLFTEFTLHFDQAKNAVSWKPLIENFEHLNRKKLIYSVASREALDNPQAVWFKALPFVGEAELLRVHLQLANRKGPLTSIEFSQAIAKFKSFAETQNAELDFPDMKEVLARAETLDQAAAALDTLLGLHCMLPETVEESTAIDLLVVAGWISTGHHWQRSDAVGVLASMVIHKAPGKRLLSFSIDVPNSHDPIQALADVITICHTMNDKFGAPLMDDSGVTLTTDAIQGIYEQLLERVSNLEDSGFKPGSPAARILFS